MSTKNYTRHIILGITLRLATCHIYQLDVHTYNNRVRVCTDASTAADCPCTAGHTNAFKCISCTFGKFKNVLGNKECSQCPSNSISLPGSVSLNSCVCKAGYFRSSVSGQCVLCAQGKYSPFVTNSACHDCPSNSNTSYMGSTVRSDCACGVSYQPGRSGQCEACTAGKFKSAIGNERCISCDSKPTDDSSATKSCECAPGYTLSSAKRCVACDRGHYKSGTGNEACLPCEPNSYAAHKGSQSCSACPAGMTSNAGAQSSHECFCPSGTFRSLNARLLTYECKSCAKGTFQDVPNQNSACKMCPLHSTTKDAGNTDPSACQCKPGYTQINNTFTDLSGSDRDYTCTPCAAGKFKSLIANTPCEQCNPSTMSTGAQASCDQCTVNEVNNDDNTACICKRGFTKKCTNEVCSCRACAAGKYKTQHGDEMCQDCDSGKYSTEGSFECVLCPVGKFAVKAGSEFCINCFANSVSTPTRTTCQCQPGFVGTATELGVSCKLCRKAYYCVDNVQRKCPEHTSSLPGSVSVHNCTCLEGFVEE